MNERLIYRRKDGSVAVVIPVNKEKTLDEIRKRMEEANPELLTYEFIGVVDKSTLPPRSERNNWRCDDGKNVIVKKGDSKK